MSNMFGLHLISSFILALSSALGLFGQNIDLCHQLCREEKTFCEKDCVNYIFNVEDTICQKQCNDDMLSCFDRCNGMMELRHFIPDSEAALSTRKQKTEVIKSSGFVDVNIEKLSSEKTQPSFSTVPKQVKTNINQKSDAVDSSCVQDCLSLEEDCERQCFIDLPILNNDCNSQCNRNTLTCVESCSSPPETVQTKDPEDIIVVVPNKITSLGLTSSLDVVPSQIHTVPEMGILRRILLGLPATGTRLIGSWHV